jgi:hypothetical protein
MTFSICTTQTRVPEFKTLLPNLARILKRPENSTRPNSTARCSVEKKKEQERLRPDFTGHRSISVVCYDTACTEKIASFIDFLIFVRLFAKSPSQQK